ncbi:MAG: hypothetical protein HQ518_16085 [Rhodopirellula sp.]|nr:hypothetical protein [Rhodopirellula sp.]
MRRTAKTSGLFITSAAAGLATLSQCNAGLLGDLFDRQADKDRNAIEKRLPASDCSFGYFSTAWQPWGTCNQNTGVGCSSGTCSTLSPSTSPGFPPGFQPGYSSGPATGDLQPYREVWSEPSGSPFPKNSSSFRDLPDSEDNSPALILMTPKSSEPESGNDDLPPMTSQPPAANPFPRAVIINPELPTPTANPYGTPGLSPAPYNAQPNATQPPLSPGFNVPLDSPRPSLNLQTPALAPRQPLPAPTTNYGSSGTGITLPPRRATSVTIDIPPGSVGSTLSLPDPAGSRAVDGATRPDPSADSGVILPGPEAGLPAVSPGAPTIPPTPQPSLRPQPPLPMPSVLPGPTAAYQYPAQYPVTQYPAGQNSNTQQVMGQYPTNQPPQFQPATHWQEVPQQQLPQQTSWRVMPGRYAQPGVSQASAESQRRPPTPSERVIFLAPPPRR